MMAPLMRHHLVVISPVILSLACAKQPDTAPTVAPAPEQDAGVAHDDFVSEYDEDEEDETQEPVYDDDFAEAYEGEYDVTTPDAARELAEAAVADRLNPKQVWKTSPVLPATWPSKDKAVKFYFYPMAASPQSMQHFQLFTAAYRVRVSLADGATDVKPLKKTRKLGTYEDRRPSVLERNELALAERALVHTVLGGSAHSGENNFWGYLKFFHENPQFARDIRGRDPKFYKWLQAYKANKGKR